MQTLQKVDNIMQEPHDSNAHVMLTQQEPKDNQENAAAKVGYGNGTTSKEIKQTRFIQPEHT